MENYALCTGEDALWSFGQCTHCFKVLSAGSAWYTPISGIDAGDLIYCTNCGELGNTIFYNPQTGERFSQTLNNCVCKGCQRRK